MELTLFQNKLKRMLPSAKIKIFVVDTIIKYEVSIKGGVSITAYNKCYDNIESLMGNSFIKISEVNHSSSFSEFNIYQSSSTK